MASKVELCNLALAELSANLINSLNKPYESNEATYCDLYFDRVRKEVLREFDWNFATTIQPLTLLGINSPTKYTYSYQIPINNINIISILDETKTESKIPFTIAYSQESKSAVITTDLENAYIKFVYNITDVGLFDNTFITAFAYRLASMIAVPLLGSQTQIDQKMISLYNLALLKAEAISAKEFEPEPITSNYYVDSRN